MGRSAQSVIISRKQRENVEPTSVHEYMQQDTLRVLDRSIGQYGETTRAPIDAEGKCFRRGANARQIGSPFTCLWGKYDVSRGLKLAFISIYPTLSAGFQKARHSMLQLRSIFCVAYLLTLGSHALLRAQAPEDKRVQTKASTWELEIPEYTGGEKSIDLQGSVNEVILGGGGRYVVTHTKPEEEIIVFDVSQGEIIYRFTVDVGTMIAVSAEFLITVTPFDKSVELRSFTNLEAPRRMKLPIDCAILKIAVGHASSGPMLLSWAEGTGDGDAAYLSFLQLPSLEPVIPRGVFQSNRGMSSTRAPIGRWGGVPMHASQQLTRQAVLESFRVRGCFWVLVFGALAIRSWRYHFR